jgi:hypothetical protein
MQLDYRMKIELTAIIIIFGVIIITISLWAFDKLQSGGDLSNAITITAEVGIGLFIAIAVFFYSKYQQDKAENLLLKVKEMNDELVLQRTTMRETFRKTILNCLKEIWKKDKLILLNLRTHGNDEIVEPVKEEILNDVIQTYKTQLLLYLQQLDSLAILASSVLESGLIASLLELRQEVEDNVVQTGMFRARQPWSAIFWRIDIFVKRYFQSNIHEFDIKDIHTLLDKDMKKDIESGRSDRIDSK